MAKKKVTYYSATEQPMGWGRAFLAGMIGAIFLMAFIDTFYMMGLTPFCLETYLGSMILGRPYGAHSWTVGVMATWVVGGLWGLLYAYCFEYVFRRSGRQLGTYLGFAHAAVAALLVFPFFETIHEFVGTQSTPSFGFFGLGYGPATFIILLLGHALYGMTVGLFYGPVRVYRVRMRLFEPGEQGFPGEQDVITEEDDHPERAAV